MELVTVPNRKGFIKRKSQECYCKYCGRMFMAADVKANRCDKCKTKKNICKCGCKQLTNGLGTDYVFGHATRDMNNKRIRLGHKKQGRKISGNNNPSKQLWVRKKISKALMGRCVWQENKTADEIENTMQSIANGRPNKYALGYIDDKGNKFRSHFEIRVANLLNVFCIDYAYEKVLRLYHGKHVVPDFTLLDDHGKPKCLIEVTGSAFTKWQKQFTRKIIRIRKYFPVLPVVVITYPKSAPYLGKLVKLPYVRIFTIGEAVPTKLKTKSLCLESDHFNFDYSHFLPWHKGACADFHGHSSKISVIASGLTDKKGMILDFSKLKKVIRGVIKEVDHKVFVPSYCLKSISKGVAKIRFISKHRYHKLDIPATEVFKLDSDSTIENITEFLCGRILHKMPWNVLSVTVKVSEGVGKSAAFGMERSTREPSSISEDPNTFLNALNFYQGVPMYEE